MAEGFANGSMQRPEKSNEWNLVGDGNDIEDWEFTNEAIKSLLRKHYDNKGNPFTQVKIDARNQLGNYLIEKDYSIIHTRNGHVFRKGISNHFGIFPEKGRTEIDAVIGKKHHIISETAILEHSSAEGVFLGCALFMEEENIYDLVLVMNYNVNPILKNKGSAIFLHLANKKFSSTKGCIAIKKKDFLKILPSINKKTKINIF